ncbi:MAG TPA: ABC transporter ATP-binding protein [Bacilli bacterium]|nr:ABC transporter ATP-binding protein [Bacilli bacterium]
MERIITLADVKKSYATPKGKKKVLQGIDLAIDRGEFVAVMGPSGSGKSTLLSIIGLLAAPTKGSVIVAGQETSHLNERQRTRLRSESIGFVFQFPSLVNTLNVRENVMLPKMLVGNVGQADRRYADDLLERVGLTGRGGDRSFQLSGGEQRRVALARALMNRPQLLLADEPTGALDDATAVEMIELMKQFHAEGTTLVMVTHDKQMAARADRLLQIRDGVMAE